VGREGKERWVGKEGKRGRKEEKEWKCKEAKVK